MRLTLIAFYGMLTIFVCNPINGQEKNNTANERVYLHYNSSLLFPGDYLYYKCYLQNIATKTLSKLSKVAYVELINEEGQTIFEHKLFLKNGIAYGDFFIDQSLPTGNYKLLAYTNWMKNQGIISFFQGNIFLINPYMNIQKDEIALDTTITIERKANVVKERDIQITINDTIFRSRSRVRLSIVTKDEDIRLGSYSLSIRNQLPINTLKTVSAKTFDTLYDSIPRKYDITKASYLPELRGELIKGTITDKETLSPIKNIGIVLSSPGQEMLLNIARTNEYGNFHFSIDKEYDKNLFSLKPIPNKNLKIELAPKEKIDYTDITFHKFIINPELEHVILRKSIDNQIENAYSSAKPDSIVPNKSYSNFDKSHLITYNLDDYTRFSSVKQTIKEVIPEVSLRRKRENYYFSVRTNEDVIFYNYPSLILLDGLFIKDYLKVVQMDANTIEKIKVFTTNFIYNGNYFKGAMIIETKSGKMAKDLSKHAPFESFHFQIPEKRKNYFTPDYNSRNEKNSSIPDFRYQLLWKPCLPLLNQKNKVEFFTSDVQGIFEVVLEGFTLSGKPISLYTTFKVSD